MIFKKRFFQKWGDLFFYVLSGDVLNIFLILFGRTEMSAGCYMNK